MNANQQIKILNLGSDKGVSRVGSKLLARTKDYAAMVGQYVILSLADRDSEIQVADNCLAKGYAGNRLKALYRMYRDGSTLIQKYNLNVITTQDPFEYGLIGWLLAKKFKIGLNVQEHGDFYGSDYWRNENCLNFFRYYLGKFILRRANSVRAVSQRIALNLQQKLGIQSDKIVTVPIYVEISPTVAIAEETKKYFSQFAGQTIFLTMARLVKQKNIPLLIAAFASASVGRDDWRLVIVGQGSEQQTIIKEIKKFDLMTKVDLLDWTERVYDFYSLADVYVLSSNYEGWGMVIVEASSCGKPIIMTDVGCANELVKNNESALISPIGDMKSLAENMKKLADNGELRKKLGTAAKNELVNLLTKEQTLEKYLASWEKALIKI